MRFWIWSQEHSAWWLQNRYGYTNDLLAAGRFTVTETAEILAKANLTHVKFGKKVNEYAILCTIEFAIIPAEMLEVETERENAEGHLDQH